MTSHIINIAIIMMQNDIIHTMMQNDITHYIIQYSITTYNYTSFVNGRDNCSFLLTTPTSVLSIICSVECKISLVITGSDLVGGVCEGLDSFDVYHFIIRGFPLKIDPLTA